MRSWCTVSALKTEGATGQGRSAASWDQEQPLAHSQWGKGTPVLQFQQLNSVNRKNELGSGFILRTSRRNSALQIPWFWCSESSVLEFLRNKWVFFFPATSFVVICYNKEQRTNTASTQMVLQGKLFLLSFFFKAYHLFISYFIIFFSLWLLLVA